MDIKRESSNEQNIAKFRDDVYDALPMIKYVAKMNMEYYKSLLDEGFNNEQAIQLVESHGINFKGK